MTDVFISCAVEDSTRIEALVATLGLLRLDVATDAASSAQSGERNAADRIEAAKAVLVAWTPQSCRSPRVRAEASRARDRRKLVPVVVETCEVPSPDTGRAEDLSDWRGAWDHPGWRNVIARLGVLVGRPGLVGAPDAPGICDAWGDPQALADWSKAYPDDPYATVIMTQDVTSEEPEPASAQTVDPLVPILLPPPSVHMPLPPEDHASVPPAVEPAQPDLHSDAISRIEADLAAPTIDANTDRFAAPHLAVPPAEPPAFGTGPRFEDAVPKTKTRKAPFIAAGILALLVAGGAGAMLEKSRVEADNTSRVTALQRTADQATSEAKALSGRLDQSTSELQAEQKTIGGLQAQLDDKTKVLGDLQNAYDAAQKQIADLKRTPDRQPAAAAPPPAEAPATAESPPPPSSDTTAKGGVVTPGGYSLYANRSIEGDDLGPKVRTENRKACEALCKDDRACRAYTYQKWAKSCFLKGGVGALFLNPRSVTGVPASASAKESPAPVDIERYSGKAFRGEPYKKTTGLSKKECEEACTDEKRCIAYTRGRQRGTCQLFDSTGPYEDAVADSGNKVQRPQ